MYMYVLLNANNVPMVELVVSCHWNLVLYPNLHELSQVYHVCSACILDSNV